MTTMIFGLATTLFYYDDALVYGSFACHLQQRTQSQSAFPRRRQHAARLASVWQLA
jgi:hypothetical protein